MECEALCTYDKRKLRKMFVGVMALSILACGVLNHIGQSVCAESTVVDDATSEVVEVKEPSTESESDYITYQLDVVYRSNAEARDMEFYQREENYAYFDGYIPLITLDYDDEHMTMPYQLQKHLWLECQRFDLDYYLMMGVIARESRFDVDADSGTAYVGYMCVGEDAAIDISKWLGLDYVLDRTDPYDNITLGVAFHRYCIDKLGSEYAGLWAYGTGIQGYYNAKDRGEVTNSDVEKAYKFRDILMDDERNPKMTVRYRV